MMRERDRKRENDKKDWAGSLAHILTSSKNTIFNEQPLCVMIYTCIAEFHVKLISLIGIKF